MVPPLSNEDIPFPTLGAHEMVPSCQGKGKQRPSTPHLKVSEIKQKSISNVLQKKFDLDILGK